MDFLSDNYPSFPVVATIGFFDGVHLGHQFLLRHVRETARKNGMKSLVITFREHPSESLNREVKPQLITTYEERIGLIAENGIDYGYILDFNQEMARLTSNDFIRKYLYKRLNVKILIIGYDHHFGSDTSNRFEAYQASGLKYGIDVQLAPQFTLPHYDHISSSTIRKLIQEGDMECANRLLGHPYSFNGTVITGHQIGRNIGFPTANINILGTNKVLPKEGVYAVKAKVNDKEHLGVANWGRRPTFELGGQPVLEVHLLDFNDNIYSQTAEISFMKYIREEKQFSSPEELQRNVQYDIDEVNLFFSV